MTPTPASEFLCTWRYPNPVLANVRLEDDIRDALQSPYVRRPSLNERQHLLELDACVGIQLVFLGFPISSARERSDCATLLSFIGSRRLPLTPVLMSRALECDLQVLIDLQQAEAISFLADIYISTSPIRMKVEGWTLEEMLSKLKSVARVAEANGIRFRLAFEDSSRTPPDHLRTAVRAAIDLGTACVVVNDTVGDCDPLAAARVTAFVREELDAAGSAAEIAWHGHNDRGLSVANALAAAEAGATIISGTFLGVGERAGNTPLEQLVVSLSSAGNTMYNVGQLDATCRHFAQYTALDIPLNHPIVGKQVFSTATGTHAAAILKARKLGVDFEDSVFSSVAASQIGRKQTLLLGPNSGRSVVRAALQDLCGEYTEDMVSELLEYCSRRDVNLLLGEELLAYLRERGHGSD